MQIPVIFSSNPLYKVLEPAAISLRGTRQIFSIKSQTCISQRGSTLNSSFRQTITFPMFIEKKGDVRLLLVF